MRLLPPRRTHEPLLVDPGFRLRLAVAIVFSLMAHGLLAAVCFRALVPRSDRTPPEAVRVYSLKLDTSDWPGEGATQVFAVLRLRESMGLSPEARLGLLQTELGRLTGVTEQDLKGMSGILDRVFMPQGQTRAFEPSSSAPAGPFEWESALPYDAEIVRAESQPEVYRVTYIDAEGRSERVEIPVAEASAEETSLAQTLIQMRSNPILNRIYRTMAMRYLPALAASHAPPAPASSASSETGGR